MNGKAAYFILASVAVFLGLGVVGASLPRTSPISVRSSVPAPVETVWAGLINVDAYSKWRFNVAASERRPSSDNQKVWLEHSLNGVARWTITEESAPHRMTQNLLQTDANTRGSRQYLLNPKGAVTELEVTDSLSPHSPWVRLTDRVFGLRRAALRRELARFAATLRQ